MVVLPRQARPPPPPLRGLQANGQALQAGGGLIGAPVAIPTETRTAHPGRLPMVLGLHCKLLVGVATMVERPRLVLFLPGVVARTMGYRRGHSDYGNLMHFGARPGP
eukprot:s3485_g10.t1